MLEKMVAVAMESDMEMLEDMVEEFKRITVTVFALYCLKQAKKHEDCKPEGCNVIEEIPNAVNSFLEEFESDLRTHVEMNLLVNGFAMGKTHNQEVADAILKEIKENSMITLPNTGGKQVHADSTGKQIAVGDKIKFRSQIYTLKGFGPKEDHYNVSTLLFEEELHTPEVPHECNVDKVD